MSKRIDCHRCMRLYREFRPAAVRIADENYCLQCVRSESLDVEDGTPIAQPTPANTPMGVPKVPDVPAPAPRKTASVAEKKEIPMATATDNAPIKRLPCMAPGCNGTHREGSKHDFCGECQQKGYRGKGADALGPKKEPAVVSAAPVKRGPKPKSKPVRTSAPEPQAVPDMATISVPVEFLDQYWMNRSLQEKAQMVNAHMLEARP